VISAGPLLLGMPTAALERKTRSSRTALIGRPSPRPAFGPVPQSVLGPSRPTCLSLRTVSTRRYGEARRQVTCPKRFLFQAASPSHLPASARPLSCLRGGSRTIDESSLIAFRRRPGTRAAAALIVGRADHCSGRSSRPGARVATMGFLSAPPPFRGPPSVLVGAENRRHVFFLSLSWTTCPGGGGLLNINLPIVSSPPRG